MGKLFFVISIIFSLAAISTADTTKDYIQDMIIESPHYPGMMLGWDDINLFLYEEQVGENDDEINIMLSIIDFFAVSSRTRFIQSQTVDDANYSIFYLSDIINRQNFESKISQMEFFQNWILTHPKQALNFTTFKGLPGCYVHVSASPDKIRFSEAMILIDENMENSQIINCLEAAIPTTFGVSSIDKKYVFQQGKNYPFEEKRRMNALGTTPIILNAFGICREEYKDESIECVVNRYGSLSYVQ